MTTAQRPRSAAPAPISAPPTEQAVIDWLALLMGDGQGLEIRALHCRKGPKTVVGRFAPGDVRGAARRALGLSGMAAGIYLVMNGVNPKLPTGSSVGRGAGKPDVPRRRWLLIDCDPERPGTVNATDTEKAGAWDLAIEIWDALETLGWPAPIVADSGNGYHLLFPVDLPNDDRPDGPAEGKPRYIDGPTTLLVKSVLNALADRFDGPAAKVDRKVYDLPRLVKFYGTKVCKGDDSPDRPDRHSRILTVPDEVIAVAPELLEALAGAGEPAPASAPAGKPHAGGKGKGRPDAETRAADYAKKAAGRDPAVSGQDGHGKTLKVAVHVGPGFDLAPDVAKRIMLDEYNPKCQPPWSEPELKRKVDEAYRLESRRGWHLNEADRNRAGRDGTPSAQPAPPLPPVASSARPAGGKPNEAIDDPHRLARLFVRRRNARHADGLTLLYS